MQKISFFFFTYFRVSVIEQPKVVRELEIKNYLRRQPHGEKILKWEKEFGIR